MTQQKVYDRIDQKGGRGYFKNEEKIDMMTFAELNCYIKHYLEEDKTHTAIMLTGE